VLESKGGLSHKTAWEACGKPGTVDNIYRRCKRELVKRDKVDADRNVEKYLRKQTKVVRTAQKATAAPRRVITKDTRKTVHQVDVDLRNDAVLKNEHKTALKAASAEWSVKGGNSEAIASRFNSGLARDVKLLTGRRVREHTENGSSSSVSLFFRLESIHKYIYIRRLRDQFISNRLAGKSPAKRGPKTKLPDELFSATATYIQMSQLAGDEQKPRQILRAMRKLPLQKPTLIRL